MNAQMPIGTRRYITMVTEMAVMGIMRGKSVRECIASAVESAMVDQATVCSLAGVSISADAGPVVEKWYKTTGAKMIQSVRPAVGLGDEVPYSGGVVDAVNVFEIFGEDER